MSEYRVKFDQSGEIIYSNAPMIPAQHDQIDRYLPLFYDIEALEDFDLTNLQPYECHIGNKKYFFHLDWLVHEIDDNKLYELTISDKTFSYNKLQEERSQKNSLRLEQDYLKERFNSEVENSLEVRNSNDELITILKHTKEGVIYQNQLSGEIVDANEKALNLFGCEHYDQLINVEHIQHNEQNKEDHEPKLFQYLWNKDISDDNNEEVVLRKALGRDNQWLAVRVIEEKALKLESLNVIFVSDVTKEYNANLSLKQKNKELLKYIESNVQLEQFAHVASHDLRAPIITIKSFSKLLEEKCKDRLNDNEQKYLSIIGDNANQMFDLVGGLLEYAQINSQKLNLTTTCSHSLVSGVINNLSSAAEQKNIKMSVVKRLPKVMIDEMKIKRVFQNLLSNAIKFSDSSKESFIKVDYKEYDDHYEYSIEDNGIGIKEGSADIFQPYTKLNLNTDYEGTGMGLAICKNILKQHNGDIYYNSKVGQGTQFIMSIKKDVGI